MDLASFLSSIELRKGHPFHMHDSIVAQPREIRKVIIRNKAKVQAASALLSDIKRVLILGIGTSYHVAIVAEYMIEGFSKGKVKARSLHSYEFSKYRTASKDELAIVVSHRGIKRFSIEALEKARKQELRTLVVTGKKSGDGIRSSDRVFETVEQEKSFAHTLSYTAALSTLALIALKIAEPYLRDREVEALLEEIEKLPRMIEEALGTESRIRRAASICRDARDLLFIGGGPNTATAWEGALKMKEANFTHAEGMNVEQFLHGPVGSVDSSYVSLLVSPNDNSRGRLTEAARALDTLGVRLLTLSDDKEFSSLAHENIILPRTLVELSPIVYAVPLQLFAYYSALERNVNPDTGGFDRAKYKKAELHYSL